MRSAEWLMRIAVSEHCCSWPTTDNRAYDIAQGLLHGCVAHRACFDSEVLTLEAYLREGEEFFEGLEDVVHLQHISVEEKDIARVLKRAVHRELNSILRDAKRIGLPAFLKALEDDWHESYADENEAVES